MLIILMVLLQAATLEEITLHNKILDEPSPAARLKLLQQFERDFPKSPRIGEIYGLVMEVYRSQNNMPKMLDYGEKSIKTDPENLQALTIIARQYAVEGRNLDKAVEYAKRAKSVIAKKRTQPKPPGVIQADWNSYLQQLESSADWTLSYVQSISRSVLRRGRPK